MRDGIYRKTDAGRDEIRDRSRRLPPALRTVLLMVDGQRTQPELREVMVHMIEEYARHLGHAALLRERIDGRIGQ